MAIKTEKLFQRLNFMESDYISFDEFKKVKLVVGEIIDVSEHPNADKLYILKVDIGENTPRTIVAGIKEFYPDKSVLVGKQVIIVANLQARQLRGVKSEGMLLAASAYAPSNSENSPSQNQISSNQKIIQLALLTLDKKLPPGSPVS